MQTLKRIVAVFLLLVALTTMAVANIGRSLTQQAHPKDTIMLVGDTVLDRFERQGKTDFLRPADARGRSLLEDVERMQVSVSRVSNGIIFS